MANILVWLSKKELLVPGQGKVVGPCVIDAPPGFLGRVKHPALIPFGRLDYVPSSVLSEEDRKKLRHDAVNFNVYAALPYREIQKLLKERGISAKGTREDLIERLASEDLQ